MEYKQIQRQRNLASCYTKTVGQTPLMKIVCPGYDTTLLLKLESFNPMGNMKFRMAISMVEAAEASGDLKPGGRIVESTSGNTGLGLATIAAERGYRFTAIVDHHAAQDKLRVMQALGAELIFVDDGETDDLSTAAREELAEKIAAADPEAFWTEQHNNPANSTGYTALAYELMEVLGSEMDALVGAVGTGGSLCGTAQVLKGALPDLFVFGSRAGRLDSLRWPRRVLFSVRYRNTSRSRNRKMRRLFPD
ncbi:PLP-dependent cysteine synthase family protein [Marinomonas sp.]|uniref:PLP-dependent cysteine synthase family protein n=1 Tax=Marinomonas sp. TaxID=1904862 RepID=UPI003BAC510A